MCSFPFCAIEPFSYTINRLSEVIVLYTEMITLWFETENAHLEH